jgi:hypothetical protein
MSTVDDSPAVALVSRGFRFCPYCHLRLAGNAPSEQEFCSAICERKFAKAAEAVVIAKGDPVAFRIFERDEFRCLYCRKSSVEDRVKLHLDHVVPMSRGGSDAVSNIATSCRTCNLHKHAKPLLKRVERRVLAEIKRRNKGVGLDPDAMVEYFRDRRKKSSATARAYLGRVPGATRIVRAR